MILFSSVMQKEKLAAIGLAIIIIGALSGFLLVTYWDEIVENLYGKEEKVYIGPIEVGDCVQVNYIGRFQVNNSIFSTNYEDIAKQEGLYDENLSYEPLKIFINPNYNLTTPNDYEEYNSDFLSDNNPMPLGFLNGLIGMNVSDKKTVTLAPEDAYGDWNESLAEMFGMGTYPLESVVNSTGTENKTLFLENFPELEMIEGEIFDYGAVAFEQEGILNATIVNVTDENLTYRLLPENGSSVLLPIFNWEILFLVENETAFTMRSIIDVNHTFSIESFYGNLHFKVTDVNETSASLAMNIDAPKAYYIGQTLIFELELIKAYDTSN